MASYDDLKGPLKNLSEEAQTARLAELQAIIEDIRAKVAEYGLAVEDIFGRQHTKHSATKTLLQPRYRDPKAGAMWSGSGGHPTGSSARSANAF